MENNKKMSTLGLNEQVKKNLAALYECYYVENGGDVAKAKDDLKLILGAHVDCVAGALGKGLERAATDADITTPKGYVVIGKIKDTAILFRPNSPYQPFVVAPHYDESDGSWRGNGRYLDNAIDAWKEAAMSVQSPKIVLSGRLDPEDYYHPLGHGITAQNEDLDDGCWDLCVAYYNSMFATDYGEGIECSYAEWCGELVKAEITIDTENDVKVSFLIDPKYVSGMISKEA